MLASKPRSGLSLKVMKDFEASRRNCVRGAGSSDGSQSASRSRWSGSKRFGGLPEAPRPRGDGSGGDISSNLRGKTFRVSRFFKPEAAPAIGEHTSVPAPSLQAGARQAFIDSARQSATSTALWL